MPADDVDAVGRMGLDEMMGGVEDVNVNVASSRRVENGSRGCG
jgi:hypothetical protein